MTQKETASLLKQVYYILMSNLLDEIENDDLAIQVSKIGTQIKNGMSKDFFKTRRRYEFVLDEKRYFLTYQISDTHKGNRILRNEVKIGNFFEMKIHIRYKNKNKKLFQISVKNDFLNR